MKKGGGRLQSASSGSVTKKTKKKVISSCFRSCIQLRRSTENCTNLYPVTHTVVSGYRSCCSPLESLYPDTPSCSHTCIWLLLLLLLLLFCISFASSVGRSMSCKW
ncbi:hypothetical protein V8G54_012793 [Vigna mungo]|uniref:Uncharacterized protein n=1 Tax=Vigna mungo TaxID=3915 RepID=A0AAQ3S2P8_VIGMU